MTPKERRLLEWLLRSSVLESQIVASGLSAALNSLLRSGFADIIADHSVKDKGVLVASAVITDKGRAALA
jgi:hypothetical protein